MPNSMTIDDKAILIDILNVDAEEDTETDEADPRRLSLCGYSDMDILHATNETIEEELATAGLFELPSTQSIIDELEALERDVNFASPKVCDGQTIVRPTTSHSQPALTAPDIPRLELVAELRHKLQTSDTIAIVGSAGCGKSHFVNRLFCANPDLRKDFPRIATIDCRALRMFQPTQIVREMIWAQFGLDEKGYQSFTELIELDGGGLRSEDRGGESDPIYKYFNRRFPPALSQDLCRGLVVLDHFDCLKPTPTVNWFLSKSLFPAIRNLGLKVMTLQRNAPTARQSRKYNISDTLDIPNLTASEVDRWLSMSTAEYSFQIPFTGDDVLREIGPRPELLSDLQAFLLSAQSREQMELKRFIFHRERSCHLPDCDRFVRTAREYPNIWQNLVTTGGDVAASTADADKLSVKDLLASGAVMQDAMGMRPMSALHERRIRALFTPASLSTLSIRGRFQKMSDGQALPALMHSREFMSDAIGKALAAENDPAVALTRFQSFLRLINIESDMALRDPGNSKLWAPFHQMDKLAPFRSYMQPDFARVIQSGGPVKTGDGRWLMPVHGNSGFISMVVIARFSDDLRLWQERAQMRFLNCLLKNVQISLSHIMERLAFNFERQFMAKTSILSRDELIGHNGLLPNFGCVGWSILDKDKQSGDWFISRIESTGISDRRKNLADMFGTVDNQLLNRYASHYSKRGVVLTASKCQAVFPVLSNESDAVYIQPVADTDKYTRLVVFVFDLKSADLKSDYSLNGLTQKWLATLAPSLIAA